MYATRSFEELQKAYATIQNGSSLPMALQERQRKHDETLDKRIKARRSTTASVRNPEMFIYTQNMLREASTSAIASVVRAATFRKVNPETSSAIQLCGMMSSDDACARARAGLLISTVPSVMNKLIYVLQLKIHYDVITSMLRYYGVHLHHPDLGQTVTYLLLCWFGIEMEVQFFDGCQQPRCMQPPNTLCDPFTRYDCLLMRQFFAEIEFGDTRMDSRVVGRTSARVMRNLLCADVQCAIASHLDRSCLHAACIAMKQYVATIAYGNAALHEALFGKNFVAHVGLVIKIYCERLPTNNNSIINIFEHKYSWLKKYASKLKRLESAASGSVGKKRKVDAIQMPQGYNRGVVAPRIWGCTLVIVDGTCGHLPVKRWILSSNNNGTNRCLTMRLLRPPFDIIGVELHADICFITERDLSMLPQRFAFCSIVYAAHPYYYNTLNRPRIPLAFDYYKIIDRQSAPEFRWEDFGKTSLPDMFLSRRYRWNLENVGDLVYIHDETRDHI